MIARSMPVPSWVPFWWAYNPTRSAPMTAARLAGGRREAGGGIGFTREHEAHLYFDRAKSTQLLLGPASAVRAEIGQAAGLLPAAQPVTAMSSGRPAPR